MLQITLINEDDQNIFEQKINNFISQLNVVDIKYNTLSKDNELENITKHYAMILYESEDKEMNRLKIGITERGDAGIDLSWYEQIKNNNVDGAILITKRITDDFISRVLQLYKNGHKIIVHCGCTGWGGSVLEPNVPVYCEQLSALLSLINQGFPVQNCVLRIDPIFPTPKGLQRVCDVLNLAYSLKILPDIRVRISIFDEYKHVKERFKARNFQPMYGNDFYAPQPMIADTIRTLSQYNKAYGLKFETCAEPLLNNSDIFIQQGCVSKSDLDILNLKCDTNLINMQQRHGCMCLSCKTELLKNRKQCPNGCLYCYWKPNN